MHEGFFVYSFPRISLVQSHSRALRKDEHLDYAFGSKRVNKILEPCGAWLAFQGVDSKKRKEHTEDKARLSFWQYHRTTCLGPWSNKHFLQDLWCRARLIHVDIRYTSSIITTIIIIIIIIIAAIALISKRVRDTLRLLFPSAS